MIDVELPESAPPTTAQPEAVSERRLLRWLTLLGATASGAGGVAGVTRAPLAGIQTCGARAGPGSAMRRPSNWAFQPKSISATL